MIAGLPHGFCYSLSPETVTWSMNDGPYVCDAQTNSGGSFGGKIWEEVVDRCKPHFNAIWERCGLSHAKEIVSISSAD